MIPPLSPLCPLSGKRIKVHYSLFAESEKAAYEKCQDITIEQTVEFPFDLVPDKIKDAGILGKIESFTKISNRKYLGVISYPIEDASNELTQFLNLLFGNISLKSGIRIEKIELPRERDAEFLPFLKGPRFGIKGARQFWNLETSSPLLCSALKPMGLSSKELAKLAEDFSKGGVDLIKDDHGLSNQKFASFEERVELCCMAIKRAGDKTIYAPNITAPFDEIKKRAKFAVDAGAKALLISPALTGYDVVRSLSDGSNPFINVPILAHPAFIGSFVTSPESGISHYALFGQLMRMIGADATIYPNFGGRFSFSKEECMEIVRGAQDDFMGLAPIFPSPGGGMNFHNIEEMNTFYGNDVIYLMGGGLFKEGPNLIENCLKLKKLISKNS